MVPGVTTTASAAPLFAVAVDFLPLLAPVWATTSPASRNKTKNDLRIFLLNASRVMPVIVQYRPYLRIQQPNHKVSPNSPIWRVGIPRADEAVFEFTL